MMTKNKQEELTWGEVFLILTRVTLMFSSGALALSGKLDWAIFTIAWAIYLKVCENG